MNLKDIYTDLIYAKCFVDVYSKTFLPADEKLMESIKSISIIEKILFRLLDFGSVGSDILTMRKASEFAYSELPFGTEEARNHLVLAYLTGYRKAMSEIKEGL